MRKLLFAVLLLPAYSLVAQSYNPSIDVQHYDFLLDLNDSNNVIRGVASVNLEFTKTVDQFSLDLTQKTNDGKGMTVTSVTMDGIKVPFTQAAQQLFIHSRGAAGQKHTYLILYSGIPADGLIISNNKFGKRGF